MKLKLKELMKNNLKIDLLGNYDIQKLAHLDAGNSRRGSVKYNVQEKVSKR